MNCSSYESLPRVLGVAVTEVTPNGMDVMVEAAVRLLSSWCLCAARSNRNSEDQGIEDHQTMKKQLAAEIARLEIEHGHEWREILQEQFGRLWFRLNTLEEKPAKEPLKLIKIRGEGGKVA
jgi:hypothetical protein